MLINECCSCVSGWEQSDPLSWTTYLLWQKSSSNYDRKFRRFQTELLPVNEQSNIFMFPCLLLYRIYCRNVPVWVPLIVIWIEVTNTIEDFLENFVFGLFTFVKNSENPRLNNIISYITERWIHGSWFVLSCGIVSDYHSCAWYYSAPEQLQQTRCLSDANLIDGLYNKLKFGNQAICRLTWWWWCVDGH